MRILFVNTDAKIRKQFLAQLTGASPVQVDAVTSSRAAIAKLAKHSYDCLILDTNLPDGNGMDLARVLPHEHMILFSSDAQKPYVKQAAEAIGISTFFIKPSELPGLVEHLEGQSAQAS